MRARLLLVASILVLAGCGSVAEEEAVDQSVLVEPSDTPTATPPLGLVPSDSDSGDASENEPDPSTDGAMAGLPQAPDNPGFHLGPEFTNDNGTYTRLVMAEGYEDIGDTPADLTASEEDVEEAIVFTGRFAAEELATSELAFDYSTEGAQAWFDEHEDLFAHPERARSGLLNTDEPNQSLALLYTDNGWDRGIPITPTRVQNLTVELLAVAEEGDQLTISHLVTFDAEVASPGGLSGTFTEKTRLHATYTVEKADGQWKIADYETTWDTRY